MIIVGPLNKVQPLIEQHIGHQRRHAGHKIKETRNARRRRWFHAITLSGDRGYPAMTLQAERAKTAFQAASKTKTLSTVPTAGITVSLSASDFPGYKGGASEPQLRVSVMGSIDGFLSFDVPNGSDPASGMLVRAGKDYTFTCPKGAATATLAAASSTITSRPCSASARATARPCARGWSRPPPA